MKKKSMGNKLVSALVTVTLLSTLLSGCGSSKKADSNKEVASNGGTEVAESVDATLPFVTEPTTLRMWVGQMDSNFTTMSNDYNENGFYKEMEKRTGVHIEFMTCAAGDTDAFNLMLASGNLPDIICGSTGYTEGLDAAVEDGLYMDLTPYLNSYLKDYNAARTANETLTKDTMTDGGKVIAAYQLYETEQPAYWGLQIRQDWLDKNNLSTPVTVDEWENVLTVFKEKEGAYAPMTSLTPITAAEIFGTPWSAGFGATGGFINKDGKVEFSAINDGWKEYITVMNRWYSKGLLDPDYMTHTSTFVTGDMTMITSNQTGAWTSMYVMPAVFEASNEDKDMKVTSAHPPVMNSNDEIHLCMNNTKIGMPVSVSATSKNQELAMKWINYLFTEEGARLANYGVEGSTYEIGEDGKPVYTDLIKNNPDGLSFAQAQGFYTCPASQLAINYDWTRELAGVNEEGMTIINDNAKYTGDWLLPTTLSLSSDEKKELASIYTDISTFVSENTDSFITGVKDVNAEWDNYVSTIKGMNIDRCVEIYQGALDRYLAR